MELAEMKRRAAETPHDHEHLLRIYLRDHEAAAVGGLPVAAQNADFLFNDLSESERAAAQAFAGQLNAFHQP